MPTSVGSITTGMAFASPNEGSWMSIPSFNGVPEPVFEDLHIIDVIPCQGSLLDDPLHGLSHVEPGASIGSGEQENAMLGTPLGQAWTLVSGQIIPDQEHPDWREKSVQLVRCWIDVPILPASSFWNHLGSWWALFQNCQEVFLEPGMQNRIGGMLYGFGSQFSSSRTKQRE